MLLLTLTFFSAGAFVFYGYGTLAATTPRDEYERFGLGHLREFVGVMQLLGATGVLVGLRFTAIGAMASAGLVTMMLLGLLVRYQLGDHPRLMVPAAVLGAVNLLLFTQHLA